MTEALWSDTNSASDGSLKQVTVKRRNPVDGAVLYRQRVNNPALGQILGSNNV